MKIRYSVKSLAELADHFVTLAANEIAAGEGDRTAGGAKIHEARAKAFEEAASIIRATELDTAPNERGTS